MGSSFIHLMEGGRDGEDMWTQGLFISMYDKIHYQKKKKWIYQKKKNSI